MSVHSSWEAEVARESVPFWGLAKEGELPWLRAILGRCLWMFLPTLIEELCLLGRDISAEMLS